MTITYSLKVSQANLSSFPRLLFLWRGSIYKLVYKELVIFLAIYYGLAILYRFLLDDEQKIAFELLCVFFKERLLAVIPISFLLGFYVTLVVGRWWNMFSAVPWTDEISLFFATHIHGFDEETRIVRRTLVRWLNLTSTIVFCSVSKSVLKRFPTMLHLVEVGLMTEDERKLYETLPTPHTKFWLPLCWVSTSLNNLRQQGKIHSNEALAFLMRNLQNHSSRCRAMMNYDWISVPLVYTQVVTIATYSFFIAKVFAAQFLDPTRGYDSYWLDLYFPVLTVIEFFFYFGWLKVAQTIINPYGGDDDDFELNYILDRNLQVGFLIVDTLYGTTPVFSRDKYWDVKEFYLPYTLTTVDRQRTTTWLGSTVEVLLQAKDFIIEVPNTFVRTMTKPKQADANVGTDDDIDDERLTKPELSELKLLLPDTEQARKYHKCYDTMKKDLKSPLVSPLPSDTHRIKRRRKRRRARFLSHISVGAAGADILDERSSETHSSRKSSVTWPPPMSPWGIDSSALLTPNQQTVRRKHDGETTKEQAEEPRTVTGDDVSARMADDMTPLWVDVGADAPDFRVPSIEVEAGSESSDSSDDEWADCSTVMMPSGATVELEDIFK
ncbi:bestrophin-4-like [Ptychodera flava]|uniref:bestrophin-4-like n=1 Tax=Ptychodera flava TaxID=63121 RepID=UPI00396A7568